MVACGTAFVDLQKRIERAATPYDEDEFATQLHDLLDAVRARCDERTVHVGQILVDRALNVITTARAVELLTKPELIEPADELAMRALSYGARFSFKLEGPEVHRGFRRQALAIAERLHDLVSECMILTNWTFAALDEGDLDEAQRCIDRAAPLLDDPSWTDDLKDKSCETRARLLAHRAKLRFARAASVSDDDLQSIVDLACEDYGQAIIFVKKHEHWRVNLQIELASSLARIARERDAVALALIRRALASASRALDGHICDDCRAYYDATAANVHELVSARVYNTDPRLGLSELEAARDTLQQAVGRYEKAGHHLAKFAEKQLGTVLQELERMKKPKQIFLSHSGVDQPRVRRFANVLTTLGFEPWFDEQSLSAGAPLERSLEEGMRNSCAAVFFVTTSFKDARFLQTEIDYALLAQRDDPEFKVIVLVLVEHATVPRVLERYVHKRAENDLEALQIILESLPIRVGTVTWRLLPPPPPPA